MSEWQPIETAPRDGTKVIVFVPANLIPAKKGRTRWTKPHTVMARWYVEPKLDGPMTEHRRDLIEKHNGYWSAHMKGTQPLPSRPTHWMTIPEPPEEYRYAPAERTNTGE